MPRRDLAVAPLAGQPARRGRRPGRAGRCRRASSRSAARARSRRSRSDGSRRPAGRGSRRRPSRRASAGPSRAAAASPVAGRAAGAGTRSSSAAGTSGAPPQPPLPGVERLLERGDRRRRAAAAVGDAQPRRTGSPSRACRATPREPPAPRSRSISGASLAPRLRPRPSSTCAERRQPVARRVREVRAAVERAPVGRQEDAHRPAAAAGHRLDRRHVDLVEVGPLLAVDLDRDEVPVQLARRSPRPRTTRAPSRGTSGRPRSRSTGRSACPRPAPGPAPPSPHGYQSTGLCACWRRYGLVSPASRLVGMAGW